MSETMLVGRGKRIMEIPRKSWQEGLLEAPDVIGRRLDFMSYEHRMVRNFVVRDLPGHGRPVSVERISLKLGLSGERAARIVRDLEDNLFFLARPGRPDVSWAFPVTVEETGHHLRFSTGERLDAA